MRQEGPGVPDRAPVVNFEQFKLHNTNKTIAP